jgi:3-phytase
LLVEPRYETDANGADGDDPAIWISPEAPELSRIVTTTKSGEGAGLAVYDLEGNQLQIMYSNEPNNVDIIYNFAVGDRTVDLAYAACRGDNTLWFAFTLLAIAAALPLVLTRIDIAYSK